MSINPVSSSVHPSSAVSGAGRTTAPETNTVSAANQSVSRQSATSVAAGESAPSRSATTTAAGQSAPNEPTVSTTAHQYQSATDSFTSQPTTSTAATTQGSHHVRRAQDYGAQQGAQQLALQGSLINTKV